MKQIVKSVKANRLENLSTFKLNSTTKLSQYEMGKIKGGDGEGDGGVDIIMMPKK